MRGEETKALSGLRTLLGAEPASVRELGQPRPGSQSDGSPHGLL